MAFIRLPISIFAAVFLSQHGSTACNTTADCSLLGDCFEGVCVCLPGWIGESCTTLALAPAPRDSGLRQSNSSNWCGTVHADPDVAGLWHMWSSDMQWVKADLDVWQTTRHEFLSFFAQWLWAQYLGQWKPDSPCNFSVTSGPIRARGGCRDCRGTQSSACASS